MIVSWRSPLSFGFGDVNMTEFATLLEDAERQVQIGLFDETLSSVRRDSSSLVNSWERNRKVGDSFFFGDDLVCRSDDCELPFLRKIQRIIIKIFTFFIDSELRVYETGSDNS